MSSVTSPRNRNPSLNTNGSSTSPTLEKSMEIDSGFYNPHLSQRQPLHRVRQPIVKPPPPPRTTCAAVTMLVVGLALLSAGLGVMFSPSTEKTVRKDGSLPMIVLGSISK